MHPKDFVEACKRERDALLATYADPQAKTLVGERLKNAALDQRQREQVVEALDAALTDAFYTMLLALDGAASLGGNQQAYRLQDETGQFVSSGDGQLEVAAHDIFHASA